jgi:D-amino-acid oxidase
VVLGGTAQYGDWNTNLSLADRERILAGCCEVYPSLAAAEVLGDWVGLRPGRTCIRLEAGLVHGGATGAVPVVHNYGHGGSGLTLAWGCAGDVVQLAAEALQ